MRMTVVEALLIERSYGGRDQLYIVLKTSQVNLTSRESTLRLFLATLGHSRQHS